MIIVTGNQNEKIRYWNSTGAVAELLVSVLKAEPVQMMGWILEMRMLQE